MEDSSGHKSGFTLLLDAARAHLKRFGKVWTFISLVSAVAGMFGAVLYATNSTRLAALENVSASYLVVSRAQGDLLSDTRVVISGVVAGETLPTSAEFQSVERSADALLVALAGFEAPTNRIRQSRDAFARTLEDLLGSLNLYDGTLESYIQVQNDSVLAANVGGEFRKQVQEFTGSTWRSFWGVW